MDQPVQRAENQQTSDKDQCGPTEATDRRQQPDAIAQFVQMLADDDFSRGRQGKIRLGGLSIGIDFPRACSK